MTPRSSRRTASCRSEVGVFVEPASAISVAGLLERSAAGEIPKGSTVVLTVTGHGLKDPQWALRTADGGDVTPTVVPVDVAEIAGVLGLSVGPQHERDGRAGLRAVPVGRSVLVKVPATTANLGPGFDTLGLALSVYDELIVTVRAEPGATVHVEGVGAGRGADRRVQPRGALDRLHVRGLRHRPARPRPGGAQQHPARPRHGLVGCRDRVRHHGGQGSARGDRRDRLAGPARPRDRARGSPRQRRARALRRARRSPG